MVTQVLEQSTKRDETETKVEGFLATATATMRVEFIDLLELEKDSDFSEMIRLLKISTFLKFRSELKFPSHTFKSFQKRYYTHLHINPEINDISLWIGAKDAQNMDDAYVRLYDLHRDELLLMLKIRCPKPQPTNEFGFTPAFADQESLEAMEV